MATTNPIDRMRIITMKIKRLEEKLKKDLSARARHHAICELAGKKRTLRHLSKLYLWGVQ